jgi:hypothetical protein
MNRRTHRDDYERWATSRCRRAADDLQVAAGNLGELAFDAQHEKTLATPAAREEFEAIERAIRELRKRVIALSPLPIADEE